MTYTPGTTMKRTRQSLLLAGVILATGLFSACGGGDSPSSPPRTSPFEGRWEGDYTGTPGSGGETGTVQLDLHCTDGCVRIEGTCSIDTPSCQRQGAYLGGPESPTTFSCSISGSTLYNGGDVRVADSRITGNISGPGCGPSGRIQGDIELRRQ